MPDLTLVQAINLALGRAMAEDPSVILLGEDIGADGGVFRATDGLLARFGSERVVDTPLAEAGIAGVSVGLAAQGFRPVAEIQFMGFAYSCLDQMLNHAARLRTRTQGRLSCPMVLRMPCGGGIHAPEHHSESGEACFTNVRGLRVVIPSSPARAYGLLLAAIRDPDPVVFLEPARLYRTPRETVEDTGKTLPLDRCFTLREGADITLVGWGGAISEVLAAAKVLAGEGTEAEVIDVATLVPLDADTILESVAKTGRCVICHEASLTGGFGAEIAARLAGPGLLSLLAPVERVTGYDTILPLPRLEDAHRPSVARILLGADLRKSPLVLIPAYDDAAGVTAAFNRNLLVRLNREASANFDPIAFRHEARWNDRDSRIEMHLVSLRDQTVTLAGTPITFAEGETIHTENSYKHTPARLLALAREAGWVPQRQWMDPAGRFGHFLLAQP